MRESLAVAYDEEPAFFPAGRETLFGILTRPAGAANGVTVTMVSGGGHLTLAGRNRMFVSLARRVADLGYHALRFDFRGTGESSGLVDRFRLDEPFDDDVDAALEFLRDRGMARSVLIGNCFGGRAAMLSAGRTAGVEGLVMVSPPVWDLPWGDPQIIRRAMRLPVWSRLGALPGARSVVQSGPMRAARKWIVLRGRRVRERWGERARRRTDDEWVSPGFLEPFIRVTEAGLPVLLVFGTEDAMYHDFLKAREGRLGRVLDRATALRLEVVPGELHGFHSIRSQEVLSDLVADWLGRLRGAAPPGEGGRSDGQRGRAPRVG